MALTRRTLLGSALATAGALPGLTAPALAAAPPAGQQAAGVYRYKIGGYELTALYDGTWFRKIDDKFVRNASGAEVEKALADVFLRRASCRPRSRRCWSTPDRSSS